MVKDFSYLLKKTESNTGDEWLCFLSMSALYINIQIRCNYIGTVMDFVEKDQFQSNFHERMQTTINKVLIYYSKIPGEWRRSVITWLFEVFHEFIEDKG
jgi:hypothetical protein